MSYQYQLGVASSAAVVSAYRPPIKRFDFSFCTGSPFQRAVCRISAATLGRRESRVPVPAAFVKRQRKSSLEGSYIAVRR